VSDFDQDLGEDDQDEPINFSSDERRLVTQSYDLSVSTLLEQWNDQTLTLPSIQREYVWNTMKASRLIESLLLNVPIPVLYFAESGDQYEIIDGHQRVSSIVQYVNNQFALTGLKVLGDEQRRGKRFHELPAGDQRRIRTRVVRAIIITEESHPAMKFEVFERLNSGSIALTAQEIRNSTHRGPFMELVKQLIHDKNFRSCIGSSKPRKRMVDNELVIRFFTFSDLEETYKPPLQKFINNYCATKNKQDDEKLEEDSERFLRATRNVFKVFGRGSFRLTDENGVPLEKNINRALAETQLITLGRLPEEQVDSLSRELVVRLGSLHKNEDFLDTIQRATGDRTRTQGRLRLYREAVKELTGEVAD
jgi:hypothetical protein